MKKKILSGLLAVFMAAGILAGCSSNNSAPEETSSGQISEKTGEAKETDKASETSAADEGTAGGAADEGLHDNGKPWINSNVYGIISADMQTDPKDDFYLYVNKDWLASVRIPDGFESWSNYNVVNESVMQKGAALLKNDSLSGHDAELVQGLAKLYLDTDARAENGYGPLKGVVEELMNASSVEELNRIILAPENAMYIPTFIAPFVDAGFEDSEKYCVQITAPALIMEDSAEYSSQTMLGEIYYNYKKELAVYMLGRMGISEEEAEGMFEDAVALERMFAGNIYSQDEWMSDDIFFRVNNVMSLSELSGLSDSYPIAEYLDALGLKYDGDYLVYMPDLVRSIDSFYTEENAVMIRNYMIVLYVIQFPDRLDEETRLKNLELYQEYTGIEGELSADERAFKLVSQSLPEPLAKEYVKMYCSEEDRKRIEQVCYDVIGTYSEMLSENDWLSPETKEYALKKLNAIKVHAGWPDKWSDYSSLDFSGLSYFDALSAVDKFSMEKNIRLLTERPDPEMWAENIDLLTCNAYYSISDNSINMILGMMDAPFYYTDMPAEELYASLAAFWIGHEVSHAFDNNGSQFDADGNFFSWWTDEDYAEFSARVGKMDDYLDGILIMDDHYINGSNVDSEMIADMTGLQCALKMASKLEDFDYEKFFEYYAQMNASASIYFAVVMGIQSDPHPLDYARVNVPVQQFEEFYEAYGISEGDNMYLAPEDRLVIW